LQAEVDPRFGRCAYFVIVETDTMEWEAVLNGSAGASGGAGIQSAQAVASMGVGAILTGNVGPNAYHTLTAAGVQVHTGAHGTVEEAVKRFKEGGFQDAVEGPTAPSHYGMGGGSGMGGGRRRRF